MGIILEEVILKSLEEARFADMSDEETTARICMEVTLALNENGIDMRERELGALEYSA